MKLLISPHNDDEALFASFTILRERPVVLIVYDSWIQYRRGDGITAEQRRQESVRAADILGVEITFCGLSDERTDPAECLAALSPFASASQVWAPAFERQGNRHHNLVATAAQSIFPVVNKYMTYTERGKSRGVPVPIAPGWILKKIKALACYESQIELPQTRDFFLQDQYEYSSH